MTLQIRIPNVFMMNEINVYYFILWFETPNSQVRIERYIPFAYIKRTHCQIHHLKINTAYSLVPLLSERFVVCIFLNKFIQFDFLVTESEGETLELTKISRLDMGAYLCIATNGVPPSVSKRIKVSVDCKYLQFLFHFSQHD